MGYKHELPPNNEGGSLIILKPRRFGNLEVTPLITGHNLESWNQNGKKLIDAMAGFPVIIPEYFPPEYRYLESDPLFIGRFVTWSHKANNTLFHQMAEVFAEQDKQIWVVDPAYNIQFAFVRGLELTAGFLPSAVATALMLKYGGNNEWTRRQFIGLNFSYLLAIGGLMSLDPTRYLEDDFRNVVASKLFEVVGKEVGSGLKAAAIYPAGHWGEIVKYSNNPQLRDKKLAWYTKLANIPTYDSLFTARNFIQENGNWKQVNSVGVEL